MPTYTYQCINKHLIEVFAKIADRPESIACSSCSNKAIRTIVAPHCQIHDDFFYDKCKKQYINAGYYNKLLESGEQEKHETRQIFKKANMKGVIKDE